MPNVMNAYIFYLVHIDMYCNGLMAYSPYYNDWT